MTLFGPPLLFALLLWWVSTGAILWLVRLPARSFGWSLALTGGLAAAAAIGLELTEDDTGARGSYLAFTFALVIWGWHEASFLMGKLTGPRRTPCPPDATGWARFHAALETLIHHELALIATSAALAALTWGAPNQIGALTFALLLGMRLSTKLNIFLGVANPPLTFLPAPLGYLKSYFRRRRFNVLFPVSMALATGVTVLAARTAVRPDAGAGEAVGYALIFGLAALGVLEHLFLMTPSPDRALWGWALDRRKPVPALTLLTAREP